MTLLLIIAFILACFAACGVTAGRWQLGWAAIAFYFASLLFGPLGHLIIR